MDLPEPRPDGKCCAEGCNRHAITNDGRFCTRCLKKLIVKLTPMVGCYRKRSDILHYDEGGNSFDNAVKVQETPLEDPL